MPAIKTKGKCFISCIAIVVILLLIPSCCTTDNTKWIQKNDLFTQKNIQESREYEVRNNSQNARKIDSSGIFNEITGIPHDTDTIAVIADLCLHALLPKRIQQYLFLKSNRKISSVYYYGSKIYEYNKFGIKETLGRERKNVKIMIYRYESFFKIFGGIFKHCRIGSQESPDYIVFINFLFKGEVCGEQFKKYCYYIQWNEDKPKIIAYRDLGGHNAHCPCVSNYDLLFGNRYLIACKKIYAYYNNEDHKLFLEQVSQEDTTICLKNVKTNCYKNGILYSACERSRTIAKYHITIKFYNVDSILIDLSNAITKDSCNWFEYLIK